MHVAVAVSTRSSIKRVLRLPGGPGADSEIVTGLSVEDTRSARWAWLAMPLLFGPVVLPAASAQHRSNLTTAADSAARCVMQHLSLEAAVFPNCLRRFGMACGRGVSGPPLLGWGWAAVTCRRDESEPTSLGRRGPVGSCRLFQILPHRRPFRQPRTLWDGDSLLPAACGSPTPER
jgi:hypothetical protein